MTEENEEEQRKTSWNLAAEQAKHIHSLLQRSTACYLHGNFEDWYFNLQMIRELLNYGITQQEFDDFSELDKTIEIVSKELKQKFKNLKDREAKVKEKVIAVRAYQRKIINLMDKMGFFPSKEDRSKLGF